ncbi:MAG: hypothetical protein HKN86_00500 [Acidimicrobiia bacterium]|nr:hypothetical protein [Acidimicrobiia bacterium]
MNTKFQSLKKEFLEKQQLLKKANEILKSEFFGIDEVIDNITKSVSSWYALSEIQDAPLVINLWGLTGVGKSHLIKRLVHLINFNDRYFHFDMSQKQSNFSFSNGFSEMCEYDDASPLIIVLDEFQHTRAVKGPNREEIEKPYHQVIWQLIDSGRIQYNRWQKGLFELEDYLNRLSRLLLIGVSVQNGEEIQGKKVFLKEFENSELNEYTEEKERLYFVSPIRYRLILEFSKYVEGIFLEHDLSHKLLQFDGFETVDFLSRLLRLARRPIELNFSKSLIFVIGNLDEAYDMSSNYATEIDADEYYEQSLKITLPKIKDALKKRFRDEQISRLGNIHLIYPALSTDAYRKIIDSNLEKLKVSVKSLTGIDIIFEQSVLQLIFSEGVFPTQGARPVLTSINYLIKGRITEFFVEIMQKEIEVTTFKFKAVDQKLICSYYNEKEKVHEHSARLIIVLQNLRKSKKDDQQAITAVHESGHAILSTVLMNAIPEVIHSVTSHADSEGFVFAKYQQKYISRKQLIPRVAVLLGGYAAEELVFGKANVTAGASSDIKKATSFISDMIKNEGLGNRVIAIDMPESGNNFKYNNYQETEEEVRQLLYNAMQMAKITLKKEYQLLLKLSEYLADHSAIQKESLNEFIDKYAIHKINTVNEDSKLIYRSSLKQRVEGLSNQETSLLSI